MKGSGVDGNPPGAWPDWLESNVSDLTCLQEECALPPARKRLCRTHYQRAYRDGSLTGLLARFPRYCEECHAELLPDAQANRRYCSKRCVNVFRARTRDRAAFRRDHKAWREQTAGARRAKFLASRPELECAECGGPLPNDRGNKRRFCNQRCGNQWHMRERRYVRIEHMRIRRRRLVGPGVTESDWVRLCNRFGGRCAYCGSRERMTMDHVVPISRGGQHAIGNVLPACFTCNSVKRARFLTEWRAGKSVKRGRSL